MKRLWGVSLLELLVALAIVAMLVTAALPSYTISRERQLRNEARVALLRLAADQAVHYVAHGEYAADPAALNHPAVTVRGHYRIEVPTRTGAGFRIRASLIEPRRDPNCLWYEIDQSQSVTTGPGGPEHCWYR